MPHEITCVRCQRLLRIAEGNTRPTLTCPHCLALVVNPRALVRTDVQAESRAAERGERQRSCPACGARTEASWRRCPHCEEPLGRLRIAVNDNSLDDEAQGNNQAAIVIAVVLGGLLLIACIFFFAGGGWKLVSASKEGPTVIGIGMLALTAIVAGTVAMVASSKNRTVAALTSVFGGLAVGAGVVILLVLLVVLALLAAIANIFQTCTKCS